MRPSLRETTTIGNKVCPIQYRMLECEQKVWASTYNRLLDVTIALVEKTAR